MTALFLLLRISVVISNIRDWSWRAFCGQGGDKSWTRKFQDLRIVSPLTTKCTPNELFPSASLRLRISRHCVACRHRFSFRAQFLVPNSCSGIFLNNLTHFSEMKLCAISNYEITSWWREQTTEKVHVRRHAARQLCCRIARISDQLARLFQMERFRGCDEFNAMS